MKTRVFVPAFSLCTFILAALHEFLARARDNGEDAGRKPRVFVPAFVDGCEPVDFATRIYGSTGSNS